MIKLTPTMKKTKFTSSKSSASSSAIKNTTSDKNFHETVNGRTQSPPNQFNENVPLR
jgi:hypothetical protein